MTDTYSVQFPYIRNSAGDTFISRNTYFFLLLPVGLNPHTTRDLIGICMRYLGGTAWFIRRELEAPDQLV